MNNENAIDVSVEPQYLPERSNPENDRFLFSYRITIKNSGTTPVTLLARHWFIANCDGEIREVAGEGVIGEQPYLLPGQEFVYTSASLMETPFGSMTGYFDMLSDDGEVFKAQIPIFHLFGPRTIH